MEVFGDPPTAPMRVKVARAENSESRRDTTRLCIEPR